MKRLSHRCNGELADLGKSKSLVKQAVHAILQAQFKAETIGVQRDVDFSKTIGFQLVTNKNSLLYVSGKNFQLKDSNDAVINPVQNAGSFAVRENYCVFQNLLLFLALFFDQHTKRLKIGSQWSSFTNNQFSRRL